MNRIPLRQQFIIINIRNGHFSEQLRRDLPGIAELRATGLLDPVEDAYEELISDPAAGDSDAKEDGEEASGEA